ncbi:hypothetical protein M2323_000403 [Rhodoblastus acidophilus]|uniref:hypothetical protein n=1 Tax=Rhodoblastus acidophilus TaxID=1074 RepID=UPI002225A372|nr:hypothetical protein [Rhodoblastus acidophilus]MCW2282642.1 hypothetical protein [Rhodoblastus acidophilus]MCW2331503.1 hypothetical protein [Rhodoblastus acidophilus]
MPTIITRLFAAEEQALAALDAVKTKFADHEISLVTPANAEGADLESLIVKGGVKPQNAPAYAEAVRQGNSVLTLRTSWGIAKEVSARLEAYEPLAPIVAETEHTSFVTPGLDNPAPFSTLLGLPVLEEFKSNIQLVDHPAPFSDLLKLPVLSNIGPFSSLINIGPFSGLINAPTPLSSTLRLPLLVDFDAWARNSKPWSSLLNIGPFSSLLNIGPFSGLINAPTPLSSALRLPLLVDFGAWARNSKPWSSTLRIGPLSSLLNVGPFSGLINNPTPLSSALRLPLLVEIPSVIHDAKPWSSLLNVGPFSGLINNPTPLSSALKLPVLLNTKKK